MRRTFIKYSTSLAIGANLDVFPSVEGFQVKFSVRLGCPESEVDCVSGLEAWDRVVIGNSCDLQWQLSLRDQPKK